MVMITIMTIRMIGNWEDVAKSVRVALELAARALVMIDTPVLNNFLI